MNKICIIKIINNTICKHINNNPKERKAVDILDDLSDVADVVLDEMYADLRKIVLNLRAFIAETRYNPLD